MRDDQHGTDSGYSYYGCRCEECCAKHYETVRRSEIEKKYGDSPSWGVLNQWALSLGFPRLPPIVPKTVADRWEREHPDRPFKGRVR